MTIKQSLPQELFAEAIWLEWFANNGYLKTEIIKELLQKYNLKLKKGKTLNDIKLACGYSVYCHGWNNDQIKEEIAEAQGKKVEEVEVVLFAFKTYARTPVYEAV